MIPDPCQEAQEIIEALMDSSLPREKKLEVLRLGETLWSDASRKSAAYHLKRLEAAGRAR